MCQKLGAKKYYWSIAFVTHDLDEPITKEDMIKAVGEHRKNRTNKIDKGGYYGLIYHHGVKLWYMNGSSRPAWLKKMKRMKNITRMYEGW